MKTIITLLSILTLTFFGYSQIVSNPGSYNWTDPAAWAGGIVPTNSDPVVIMSNSTILVDIPLVHDANIDITGGVLASGNPLNNLTINNANLSLLSAGSQLAFGIGVPVPVTINNGVLTNNNGVITSGNFYILYTSVLPVSVNNGDMMVSGTLMLDDSQFDNYVYVGVSGELIVTTGASALNTMSASVGTITNGGLIQNEASWNVADSIVNISFAIITSTGGNFTVGTDVNNDGDILINDNMNISGSLNNSGTFTNNGGAVDVSTNFLNSGTITGSMNGSFLIAMNSENTATGIMNGTIDVCDTTLVPGTYLDIDNGQANVDFNTVTFCSTSYAGIEINQLSNVLIIPNPTDGKMVIEGIDYANILLFSNDGRLLEQYKIDGTMNVIDLTNHPTGVYTLRIDSETASITKRIIKQ